QLGVEELHIVHLARHLMELQHDGQGGAMLRDRLVDMGFHVHLDKLTREVPGENRVTGLRFSDGTMLDCEMVIVSTGIRPNVTLAQRAGLTVDRGIVIGDDLRSPDDPHIYAVGECTQHRGTTYGLVAPLWEQTRVLAE